MVAVAVDQRMRDFPSAAFPALDSALLLLLLSLFSLLRRCCHCC